MPNREEEVSKKLKQLESDEKHKKNTARTTQVFDDLKATLKNYYGTSKEWRKTSFEPGWDEYHRNYRSIYDPEDEVKKEKWQIKMFVPLTVKHIQRVVAQIYKTILGLRPNFEMEVLPGGDEDQAEMITDLMLHYIDKSGFKLKYNDQITQCAIYGNGFSKAYWQTIKETRVIREPVRKKIPVQEMLYKLVTTGKLPKVVDYKETAKVVETYNGIQFDWVDIHDIFLDPNNLNSWKFHRTKIKYGDLVKGAKEGYYYKDAVERLRGITEGENEEESKKEEKQDLLISDVTVQRVDYEKSHSILEFWGRLPRKYIYWWKTFKEEEGNEIIPAKCLMTENGNEVISIEENSFYDGGDIFNKMGYINVPGSHYDIGIAELLAQIQKENNALRNQRVDNGTLQMNTMFAVREGTFVDKEDLESKPGGMIRVSMPRGADDIRKSLQRIDMGYTAPSEYQETLELEKEAQEVTGVSKVTMGSGGQFAKDTNQTARGMQMLKQSSLELINYYTSLMEMSSFVKILRLFYMLIYQNVSMEDIKNILGAERALKFELLPIEEVEKYYKFKPTGTFSMENRQEKIQNMVSFQEMNQEAPFVNHPYLAKQIGTEMKIDNIEKIVQVPDQQGGQPGGLQANTGAANPAIKPPSNTSNEVGPLGSSLESPL